MNSVVPFELCQMICAGANRKLAQVAESSDWDPVPSYHETSDRQKRMARNEDKEIWDGAMTATAVVENLRWRGWSSLLVKVLALFYTSPTSVSFTSTISNGDSVSSPKENILSFEMGLQCRSPIFRHFSVTPLPRHLPGCLASWVISGGHINPCMIVSRHVPRHLVQGV
jgi:hypothetical protein